MRKIFFNCILLSSFLFSNANLNIEYNQLQHISYQNNIIPNQLILNFKKAYWQKMLDFSITNMNKQVTINIDNIHTHPVIMGIVFNTVTISIPENKEINKKFKININENNSKKNTENEIEFLFLMLKKYPNNYYLREELILNFHMFNTIKDSKSCIKIYDTSNAVLKERIIRNQYQYIFDCYTDLNKTDEAFKLLSLADKIISKNERYIILEKKAFLYQINNELEKSKFFYQKSIYLLEETDFSMQMKNFNEEQKREILNIKNNELKRLKNLYNNEPLADSQRQPTI